MATPNIAANGAVLLDVNTGEILYGKNENERFYPASTTKVLTSLILLENMENKNAVLAQTQSSKDIVPSDSSSIGLTVGDTYSYLDGIHAVLLNSDNFISHDLAVLHSGSISKFSQTMNSVAHSVGATNSNFTNPHGYHDPQHYTTPADLAKIINLAFSSQPVIDIASKLTYNFTKINTGETVALNNTSQLINPESQHYNPYVVATKTGWHTAGGSCLVARADYDDISLIGIILQGESQARYTDMNELFSYGESTFKSTYIKDAYNDGYVVENISINSDSDVKTMYINVDGVLKMVKTHAIDDSNYVHIRDFATILSGTNKAFEVGWNNAQSIIELSLGKSVGKFSGVELSFNDKLGLSQINRNGELIWLQTYTQNGNTYFKLRDLANLVGVDLSWNATTGAMISTK